MVSDLLAKLINKQKVDINEIINSTFSEWHNAINGNYWLACELMNHVDLLNKIPSSHFFVFMQAKQILTNIDDVLTLYKDNLKDEYLSLFFGSMLQQYDEPDIEELIIYTEDDLKDFYDNWVRFHIEDIYISNQCLYHFYNFFRNYLKNNEINTFIKCIGNHKLDMPKHHLFLIQKELPSKQLDKALFQAKLLF